MHKHVVLHHTGGGTDPTRSREPVAVTRLHPSAPISIAAPAVDGATSVLELVSVLVKSNFDQIPCCSINCQDTVHTCCKWPRLVLLSAPRLDYKREYQRDSAAPRVTSTAPVVTVAQQQSWRSAAAAVAVAAGELEAPRFSGFRMITSTCQSISLFVECLTDQWQDKETY